MLAYTILGEPNVCFGPLQLSFEYEVDEDEEMFKK